MGENYVTIDKKKVKLTSQDKILFPGENLTKADLVNYYQEIAEFMLPHIRDRAISMIRFPDGLEGERFFQKNKPKWAPEWVESVKLGKDKIADYVIANDKATLAWLANLGCIEIHIRQDKTPRNNMPDFFVFDLDPTEEKSFSTVKDLAFELKSFLEKKSYHPLIKTTGGKGLHLVMPLKKGYSYEQVFDRAKSLAEEFASDHSETTTLEIRKEKREGKLLLDIYRNRAAQTIVAPYSVRGKEGAPVSFPITWEEANSLTSSAAYTMTNALEIVKKRGDVWKDFRKVATAL